MITRLLLILSLITTVNKHVFRTQYAVEVDAPAEMSDVVIDQLIYDFQHDFEHLFSWAFLNLGKQNDSNHDALLLESKSITYEPENEFGSITLDVIVPHFITIHDVYIQGLIRDERGDTSTYAANLVADSLLMDDIPTWSRHVLICADESSFIFSKAFGNLYVIPTSPTSSIYFIDINFRFEWYLRWFVSKRIYQNTIQWRVQQYLENLKRAAEQPEFMQ